MMAADELVEMGKGAEFNERIGLSLFILNSRLP